MKFKPFFLLAIPFSLISCESIIDNIIEQKQQENYVSIYTGTYVGTYTGQDNGTLKLVVSPKDIVTVTRHSSVFNLDEEFFGGLIGPSLSNLTSKRTGFKLDGNLTSPTKTYTGTWSQSGLSGTWTFTKQ